MWLLFPTGLPPLSIAFNGNTKFKRQYNEEKGVGERKRLGVVLGNPLWITAIMGRKPDTTNQNSVISPKGDYTSLGSSKAPR
jgi:hypothetical protein